MWSVSECKLRAAGFSCLSIEFKSRIVKSLFVCDEVCLFRLKYRVKVVKYSHSSCFYQQTIATNEHGVTLDGNVTAVVCYFMPSLTQRLHGLSVSSRQAICSCNTQATDSFYSTFLVKYLMSAP